MDRPRAQGDTNNTVFISRQPIYKRSGELFAYELLYHREALTQVLAAKDQKAGSEIFLSTLLHGGMEPLGNGTPTFIRMTPAFIRRNYCKSLPKEGVVLEIPQSITWDDDVFRSLGELKNAGHNLALSDFDFSPQAKRLLDLADYVKIDFENLLKDNAEEQFSRLEASKRKPIATAVGTHDALELAKRFGFEYYSGGCFVKPKGRAVDEIATNRLITMQLVMKLHEPDLKAAELESLVKQDLAISFKLLRYVNSGVFALPRNVDSFRTAIQLVGINRLRTWASLLFLSKLENKPVQLIITALVRAKMAECLAMAMGEGKSDTYYMVGLFSLVDALINVPMQEAIQQLPFSDDVRDALISHTGPYGHVLKCVLSYENGYWEDVTCGRLDAGAIRDCYLVSVAAAHEMLKIAGT